MFRLTNNMMILTTYWKKKSSCTWYLFINIHLILLRNITINNKKKKAKTKEFLKIFKISINYVPLLVRNPRKWGRHNDKGAFVGCKSYSPVYTATTRVLEQRTTRITTEFLVAWSHNGISALSRNRDVATRRNDQVNF